MLQLLPNTVRRKADTTKSLMYSVIRNIVKMFWNLGIRQLCVHWIKGNFPIKQFGTSYWIPTWTQMMIQLDPWHSNTPSLNTMELMNNYPLTFEMLDSKQFPEVMEFINAHYKICFNDNKVSGQHNNFDNFTQNWPYCLYYHLYLIPSSYTLYATFILFQSVYAVGLTHQPDFA